MRRQHMSKQEGSEIYLKDMMLDANLELGDSGPRRRR
jgi:hypothetical protein